MQNEINLFSDIRPISNKDLLTTGNSIRYVQLQFVDERKVKYIIIIILKFFSVHYK